MLEIQGFSPVLPPGRPLPCRNEVNKWVRHVVRASKWAASEGLVPPSAHHGLKTVPGLESVPKGVSGIALRNSALPKCRVRFRLRYGVPALASHRARTSPVGPAPTIRTCGWLQAVAPWWPTRYRSVIVGE